MFAVLSLLLFFVTVTKSEFGYDLSYKSIQEFDKDAVTTNGVVIAEISGVSQSSIDSYYYGIMDSVIDDKPIYVFSVSVDNNNDASATFSDSIPMGNTIDVDTTAMDSEGIAYITTDAGNDFVIIATEGHRTKTPPRNTHLFVYELDGSDATYIEDLEYLSQFDYKPDSGPIDNKGVESLTTDPSRQHLFYSTQLPLLQDECDTCIRIVVSDISVDGSNIGLDIDYTLRYDTDSDLKFSDILVINDGLDALVLENGKTGGHHSNRIYATNLNLNGGVDVTNCDVLTDSGVDCGSDAIDKTLLFDTANQNELAALGNDLDLEALGLRPSLDGCSDLVFGVSDNGNSVDTYFVFFELQCAQPIDASTEAPPQPIDTSTEAPQPIDVSTEAPLPIDASTEAPVTVGCCNWSHKKYRKKCRDKSQSECDSFSSNCWWDIGNNC